MTEILANTETVSNISMIYDSFIADHFNLKEISDEQILARFCPEFINALIDHSTSLPSDQLTDKVKAFITTFSMQETSDDLDTLSVAQLVAKNEFIVDRSAIIFAELNKTLNNKTTQCFSGSL